MPSYARNHQLKHSLVYHAYSRSCNRKVIFSQPDDFEHFKQLLRDYKARFEMKIYHWVIMSNHYHLVIELMRPEEISKFMAGLHRAYAYYHHRAYGTVGFLWQGRFKLQPIQKELYLRSCGRYVERNPVRAGMVNEACEYKYSSANYYCLGLLDSLTNPDPYYLDLSNDQNKRKEEYRRFLHDFDSEEERYFQRIDFPCGSAEFLKRLVFKDRHLFPRRRGRA